MTTVFDRYIDKQYPFRFNCTLLVSQIAGGTPTDPKVAEAWLRTKLADKDDLIREQVAQIMVEMGVSADEAAQLADSNRHLNGFKRNSEGLLFIEGRQLKACLKEAASVAANAGRISSKGWGNPDNKNYAKGLKSWFPEHVFVVEHELSLGVEEPTRVVQRFVHTRNGNGIQYEQVVENAEINCTIETDYEFTDEQWATIWLTAERQGIGASRSQGYGRFEVVRWEPVNESEAAAQSAQTNGANLDKSGVAL